MCPVPWRWGAGLRTGSGPREAAAGYGIVPLPTLLLPVLPLSLCSSFSRPKRGVPNGKRQVEVNGGAGVGNEVDMASRG